TNYYWKVTSTDGTTSWYGGNESGVVSNTVIKNSENKIVHWGLYKVQDVYGNNIIYDYYNTIINSFSGADSNLNGGRVFNINTIRYTGHNNTLGDYRIVFFRKITNLKFNQEINARLGVKKIDPYLLDKIKVYNKKEIVREYQF